MESREKLYNEAVKLIKKGRYFKAYNNLRHCGNYKNTRNLLKDLKPINDKRIITTYNANKKIVIKHEYVYNESGDIILQTTYDSQDNIVIKYEWAYDEQGNVIHEIEYKIDGSINCKAEYEYTYNEFDKILLCIKRDTEGNIVNKNEHSYDKNGNKIQTVVYDAIRKTSCTIQYVYDEHGNMT
ncbi:MAG: hypothetical protein IKZ05_00075, partial [Clostridia bacterium]|nr:hypothetical protein [Clostridia bacterium]